MVQLGSLLGTNIIPPEVVLPDDTVPVVGVVVPLDTRISLFKISQCFATPGSGSRQKYLLEHSTVPDTIFSTKEVPEP